MYSHIQNIPTKAHEYNANDRSPQGWFIDQYQVSIAQGLNPQNGPNDQCHEHSNPRYILERIPRAIEASVQTVRIVKGLPKVEV